MSGKVPLSRDWQIRTAAELYEKFSGHDAEEVARIKKPSIPDAMVAIGQIDGILYTTVRDGVTERYIHRFKKSSRPLLAVSPDGKTVQILGGEFEFTELGFVDR